MPTTSGTGAGAWVEAAPASEKTTMLDQTHERYAHEWAYHSHCRTPLAKLTSKINQDFAGKISVWAGPRAWLCKSCSKHGAQSHPRLVGRSPREPRRPIRNGKVSSASTNRKKDCAKMSEQSQTWEDVRPTTTSPWTTGTEEGAESEHKGQPHEDRVVKAVETNKIRDCKPPPSTQSRWHLVFSEGGEKRRNKRWEQAARRRLEKT